MKYTDGLFSFPVRIYDRLSIRRAAKREEDLDIPMDGEWVEGTIRIPFNEVKGIMDYYSKGREISDVEKDGFDCCIVMTNTLGDFIANVPQDSLMSSLNSFVDWYYKEVESMAVQELKEKPVEVIPRKQGWRRKFRL